MQHFLLTLCALLFSASLSFGYGDDYSNPYGNSGSGGDGGSGYDRFNTYPDGSSRPLNPGPSGRYDDSEYNSRRSYEAPQRPRYSGESGAPAYGGPRDSNVFLPDGKMLLCTTSRDGRTTTCQ